MNQPTRKRSPYRSFPFPKAHSLTLCKHLNYARVIYRSRDCSRGPQEHVNSREHQNAYAEPHYALTDSFLLSSSILGAQWSYG